MTSVTEQELKDHQKNIGGKRVTLDGVHENIKDTQFIVVPGSQLTICVLTLQNGYTVTGESACADPAMFDREIGEKISKDNAIKKIWPLMGYALKQEIFLSGSGDFKDRVRQEARELQDKLAKLETFIHGSEQMIRLSAEDQLLLVDQYNAMRDYLNILNKRIDRF